MFRLRSVEFKNMQLWDIFFKEANRNANHHELNFPSIHNPLSLYWEPKRNI